MKKNGFLIVALVVAAMSLVACGAPAPDTSAADAAVAELEAQVADLQAQLDDASDDEVLADLEAQIAALQDQLDAAEEEAEAPAEEPAAEVKTYEDLVVGFAQIGAESEWRTAETNSILSTAEELGVELKFSDAQQQQENQIAAIRSFIAQGVDVIGVAPVVDSGWEPVFQEAADAGIPIVLVDRGVSAPEDLYATFIGSDFVLEGENACKEMARLLEEEGDIIELQGTVGASAATDRMTGFADCLEGYPNMSMLDSQSGNFTRAEGKEVMEAFLQTYGDEIDGVYAHNDDMAIGAIQAIEEYGLEPGVDIKLVSVDGVKGAFEAMAAGQLNCTVECNPLLGPQFFEAALALANGEEVDKWIKSDEGVYCEEVAADMLPDRKY